jgi:hypothetical protein
MKFERSRFSSKLIKSKLRTKKSNELEGNEARLAYNTFLNASCLIFCICNMWHEFCYLLRYNNDCKKKYLEKQELKHTHTHGEKRKETDKERERNRERERPREKRVDFKELVLMLYS